jgi:hypothetical protein
MIILTLWDGHYREVRALSGPNQRADAPRPGYAFAREQTRLDQRRGARSNWPAACRAWSAHKTTAVAPGTAAR